MRIFSYLWDWSFGSVGTSYQRRNVAPAEVSYVVTDAGDRVTTDAGDYIIIG